MALTKVLTGGLALDAVDNTILKLDDDYALTGTVSGAGKIGQMPISTHLPSAGSALTSTSYADIGSATVSITPAATSSKIWHVLNFNLGHATPNSTWFRVIVTPAGGSAAIVAGTGTAEDESFYMSTRATNPTYDFSPIQWNYLHAANSTVAQVYKLQYRVDSSTSYINRIGAGTANSATFNWTVMEILG